MKYLTMNLVAIVNCFFIHFALADGPINDGGTGNLFEIIRPSEEQIRLTSEYLWKNKIFLQHLKKLNNLYEGYLKSPKWADSIKQYLPSFNNEDFISGLEKVYNGTYEKNIDFNTIKFIISNTDCVSPLGKTADGSYTRGKKISTICISAPRIAKKSTLDNFETNIESLIQHEFSHHFNTTESEANALQAFFESFLQPRDLIKQSKEEYLKEPLMIGCNYQVKGFTENSKWGTAGEFNLTLPYNSNDHKNIIDHYLLDDDETHKFRSQFKAQVLRNKDGVVKEVRGIIEIENRNKENGSRVLKQINSEMVKRKINFSYKDEQSEVRINCEPWENRFLRE